jgi:hypothetical protein
LGRSKGLSVWRAGPESARDDVAGQDGFAAANGQGLKQVPAAGMLRRNGTPPDAD